MKRPRCNLCGKPLPCTTCPKGLPGPWRETPRPVGNGFLSNGATGAETELMLSA